LRNKNITTKNAMVAQTTVPKAGVNSASMELSEGDEQADDGTEEGYTLNQCGCDDHVGTEITGHFWLASHGLQGGATNASNTKSSSDSCSTCAESGQTLSNFKKDSQQFHVTVFERMNVS
jgi:hypothetical protein